NENAIGVVPQSGNTGLVGGQIPSPDGSEIVLSLARLKNVRDIDVAGGTMIVEAGVTLLEAQSVARDAGALFPLSLASEG
ncbi:FAD-binding oxidoreductase, partial [Streptococcus pyogenes]